MKEKAFSSVSQSYKRSGQDREEWNHAELGSLGTEQGMSGNCHFLVSLQN
jgi:hypothetical protein